MMQAVAITPESSIEEQISRYIEQQVRAVEGTYSFRDGQPGADGSPDPPASLPQSASLPGPPKSFEWDVTNYSLLSGTGSDADAAVPWSHSGRSRSASTCQLRVKMERPPLQVGAARARVTLYQLSCAARTAAASRRAAVSGCAALCWRLLLRLTLIAHTHESLPPPRKPPPRNRRRRAETRSSVRRSLTGAPLPSLSGGRPSLVGVAQELHAAAHRRRGAAATWRLRPRRPVPRALLGACLQVWREDGGPLPERAAVLLSAVTVDVACEAATSCGLEGGTLRPLVSGSASFTSLSFKTTSYNLKGRHMHLMASLLVPRVEATAAVTDVRARAASPAAAKAAMTLAAGAAGMPLPSTPDAVAPGRWRR